MTDATSIPVRPRSFGPVLFLAVPFVVLGWAYWTTLQDLSRVWATNPSYSHGYMVPLFALFLLWVRRKHLAVDRMQPSILGVLLLAAGLGARLVGTYFYFSWLDPLSLIPVAAGVFLMVGGWAALRWAWPACLFLFFMIPLPYSLSYMMSGPLQRLATIMSTFLMQMLGLPALAEGNTILVNDATIGVVEACSGLRMLMVFFALSTGVALVIQRSMVEKTILVLSAIPISLAVNILRITATGALHELGNGETANAFYHDLAGWFMMPLALVLLWGEYKLLVRLFVPATALAAPRRASATTRKGVAQRPASGRTRPTLPPRPRDRGRVAPPRTNNSGPTTNS
jgi:exosortase